MKRIILLSLSFILIVLLVIISFPKTLYKETDVYTKCDCLGVAFSYNSKCIGFSYACEEQIKSDESTACEETTCAGLLERIASDYEEKTQQQTDLFLSPGADIVLVLDASFSMDGEKLRAAKDAASSVVRDKKNNDRMAIVTFSETAELIRDFTDDTQDLLTAIESINVSGGTTYLPALETAQDIFSSGGRDKVSKGIIFLSDGIPSDDTEEIINTSREIRFTDIDIFTIGFGITDDQGSILKEMVGDDEYEHARWYRSFSDTKQISDAFTQAYQEITNYDIINIIPDFTKREFNPEESLPFILYFNETRISSVYDTNAICLPELEIEAIGKTTNETFTSDLDSEEGTYSFATANWPNGTYYFKVLASLQLVNGDSCSFSGKTIIGDINITNNENPCNNPTCEETTGLLKDYDFAALAGSKLSHDEDTIRAAVLVDISDSMSRIMPEVLRAVNRVNLLLSGSDERALITFSDDASLRQPLTTDKEKFSSALENISLHGTTRLIPALKKTRLLFSSSPQTDVAIIFTDGKTHDQEGYKGVEDEIDRVLDYEVCLYIIGYGTDLLEDKKKQELFIDSARKSKNRLGCGDYYYTPESEDLVELITTIFEDLEKETDLTIWLNIDEINYVSTPIVFSFSTTSSKTGLLLPVSENKYCIPEPTSEATVLQGKEVIDTIRITSVQNQVFGGVIKNLKPGKYTLQVISSIDTDSCSFSGVEEREFFVIGDAQESFSWLIGLIIVLLIIGSIISAYFYWKI